MNTPEIVKSLKKIQADSHAVFIKLHSYNWNVGGTNFVAVQNMTELLYDYMARLFNDSAEHIVQLDEKPYVTLKELEKNRSVKDDATVHVDYKYVARQVTADLERLKKTFASLADVCGTDAPAIRTYALDNIGFINKEIAAIECL